MSISLEGRNWWRKTAPFHVQLELQKSRHERSALSDGRVEGRAIRVFRTDGRLAAGDYVAFRIWFCEPGDEPTGPAYIYFDDFLRATHMEVYLHGTPPHYELAAYEFRVIDAPSEQPQMNVEELHEDALGINKKRRWWQFLKP